MLQKVTDMFVEANPNYQVTVLKYDGTTYDQKLLTDIVAGTLPDLFVSADVYTKPFFDSNLTADLKPLAEAAGYDLVNLRPALPLAGRVRGHGRLPAARRRRGGHLLQQDQVRRRRRGLSDSGLDLRRHAGRCRDADHQRRRRHHAVRHYRRERLVGILGADGHRRRWRNPQRGQHRSDLQLAGRHPGLECHLHRVGERLVRSALGAGLGRRSLDPVCQRPGSHDLHRARAHPNLPRCSSRTNGMSSWCPRAA